METYGEVNEIMAISYIYDKDMQLDSYRRFKNVINQINEKTLYNVINKLSESMYP